MLRLGTISRVLLMAGMFCSHSALAADGKTAAKVDQHALAVIRVRQLGDASFAVRERATRELAEMGLPAKAALLDGLKHGDAEVRVRCRRALLDVLEADYQARLAAFASDKSGGADYDLPGWTRYRQLVGDDAPARELFWEMQQSEAHLLESANSDPSSAAEVLEERCNLLQGTLYRTAEGGERWLSLGTVAALYFVAGDPQVQVHDRHTSSLHNFSYQQPFSAALEGGSKAPALRKILGAWIVRNTGTAGAYPSMMLAMRYELREGLEPALNLVRTQAAQPQILQAAVLAVGRFGDKQHIPDLEKILENNVKLLDQNLGGQQMRTELCDVALAVLLHLTRQDAKEYGLERLAPHPQNLFNASSIGFFDDAARQAALKKWKEWAALHRAELAG